VDVDRALLDLGLDQMVFDLLVDDRPDHPHDRRGREVLEQGHDADQEGGDGGADERDEREEAGDHGERGAERHAEDRQHDVGGDARYHRDRERPRDVAADRLRHVVERAAQPLALLRRSGGDHGVGPTSPVAQQEGGQHEDRDQREGRVDDPEAHVAQRPGRAAQAPRQLARLLLELARDVVVLVQLAQAVVLAHELGHVARVLRHVVGEVVRLGDQRRDDQGDQERGDRQQAQVDDRHGEAALHLPRQPVDGRR
jgi:hypothetical protein